MQDKKRYTTPEMEVIELREIESDDITIGMGSGENEYE